MSLAAGTDWNFAITKGGEALAWGRSADYRTGLGSETAGASATPVSSTDFAGRSLARASCGGRFTLFAGPAQLSVGDDGPLSSSLSPVPSNV